MQRTHVVTVCAKRFYRVYVEENQGEDLDYEKIKKKAVEELIEADECERESMLDDELEIEEQDILSAQYDYEVEGC